MAKGATSQLTQLLVAADLEAERRMLLIGTAPLPAEWFELSSLRRKLSPEIHRSKQIDRLVTREAWPGAGANERDYSPETP